MPGKGTCPVLPPPPATGSLEGQPPATSLSLPLQPTDFSFVVFKKGETVWLLVLLSVCLALSSIKGKSYSLTKTCNEST